MSPFKTARESGTDRSAAAHLDGYFTPKHGGDMPPLEHSELGAGPVLRRSVINKHLFSPKKLIYFIYGLFSTASTTICWRRGTGLPLQDAWTPPSSLWRRFSDTSSATVKMCVGGLWAATRFLPLLAIFSRDVRNRRANHDRRRQLGVFRSDALEIASLARLGKLNIKPKLLRGCIAERQANLG